MVSTLCPCPLSVCLPGSPGSGDVPDVAGLQVWIERAWRAGEARRGDGPLIHDSHDDVVEEEEELCCVAVAVI
jgi:hypothetical protein